MTKYALILAGVLGLGSTVASAATVGLATQSVTNLGGGKYGYTIKVVTDDGKALSFGTNTLTFTGAISQQKAFGALNVNKESDANTYAAIPGSGYTKSLDSWYYNSIWTTELAPQASGPVETANSYSFSIGTATGYTTDTLMAYIVAGDSLSYSGIIAREGKNYNVAGTFAVPEPASMSLLALGGLALIRRARRA